MNLNRVILKPDGEESYLSYPSQNLVNSLLKLEDGSPDFTKFPKDTVKNVLLQCLNFSNPKDMSESLMVNFIGQEIIKSDKELNLKPKFKDFLVDVLKNQIYTEEKMPDGTIKPKGTYKGWAIVQVLEELGVKTNVE